MFNDGRWSTNLDSNVTAVAMDGNLDMAAGSLSLGQQNPTSLEIAFNDTFRIRGIRIYGADSLPPFNVTTSSGVTCRKANSDSNDTMHTFGCDTITFADGFSISVDGLAAIVEITVLGFPFSGKLHTYIRNKDKKNKFI